MKKLIRTLAVLGLAPIIAIATVAAAAPVFADTPGVSPTCFPQTMNPHPTDPAGTTTNTLFCTAPSPTPGTGNGSGGRSGSGGSGGSGAGTTAGGRHTSLASSTESGTTGSALDES